MRTFIYFLSLYIVTAGANDESWKRSTLALEGINPERFLAVESYFKQDVYNDLQSVAIVKNDKLVYEQYFNGASYLTRYDIRSATKSFISALVGIAIDQGKINSINDPIMPYFSDYFPVKHLDKNKKSIRIIDLLTMTSGFNADVDNSHSLGHEDKMEMANDWVKFAIDIPVINKPGVKWSYASMNTFLLGYILEQATGEKLDVYAQKYLFQPLGITNMQWSYTPKGRVVAQGNFRITTRDMAKFGYLYLNNGSYNGKQIISKQWVVQSTTGQYPVYWHGYHSYGFKWYNHSMTINEKLINYYSAAGNGGQKICIIPDLNMVVTITTTAFFKPYANQRSVDILKLILQSVE